MRLGKIAGLIFVFLLSPSVWAACGLSILASNLNLTWDLNWATQSISILVSKTNPAACTFGLGFSKGGAGSYTRYASASGKTLSYQVYQDTAKTLILKDVPDIASVNDVIMVTLPAGSNPQTVMYYFDIPYASATSPTLVAAGTYLDNFTINAYEGSNPAAFADPPAASASVGVSIEVDPMIALSLVDTGGVFQTNATSKTIDFGNLTSGEVSRFDIRLRTNAGFSVTFVSANGGRFKHNTRNSYVPYKLYVNNALVDVTGGTPGLVGSGQTSLVGLGYATKIVVGATAAVALAGGYSDTITITATTTE